MGNCVNGGNGNLDSNAATDGAYTKKTSECYDNSNPRAENAVLENSPKISNNNDNKSKGSKVIVSDQNKQIKPEHTSRTIPNQKNIEVIEVQKCDSDLSSSHTKEEQETIKQHFGEASSLDNQQISEPKVQDLPNQVKNSEEISCSHETDSNDKSFLNDLHHATQDINGTENINNLSKSEMLPIAQENTKEFEGTGDSREFDNKCLVSSLEESLNNQNQSSKIENKEKSFQAITEESEETGDSGELEKHLRKNQILSTDKDKQIAASENCEKSEETGDTTKAAEDPEEKHFHENQILSTADKNKQITVSENCKVFEETRNTTEADEDSHNNQIQSTTNEVKQIFQENSEESKTTSVNRQAEEDSCKHQSQSPEDEDQQISAQENSEKSEKTGDSKQTEDSYENQVSSPEKEDKLSELSESNILHAVPNVENNSFLPTEEQSEIQEQQEDKSKFEKLSGTNILNLQEHFTNSDPSNITYQNNSIEYILEIEERAKKFDYKVAKYSGTNYSVDYFVIDENLTRLIECLDKVKLQQDQHLLKEKIRVIDYIRSLQSRLDENVTEK